MILVLNAGSSSLKLSVYELQPGGHCMPVLKGQVEGIGRSPRAIMRDGHGLPLVEVPAIAPGSGHSQCLSALRPWLERWLQGRTLLGVGHRVVHGGTAFRTPVLVDAAVVRALEELVPLAPLHQPHNIAGVRAIAEAWPHVPQVACFDTAFHRTQPAVAASYALPRALRDQGVERYGFHGLSYASIAERLPQLDAALARGKVIVAHLGNGASLCALAAGLSVATTMGFSALDGLPMGTRAGSLDPGVVLYLLRQGWNAQAIETLLYKESGLLALSRQSSDMRDLLASNTPEAAFAVNYFVYRVAREVGSLAAALGGLDALIFTAGIGEHSAEIRARILSACAWLGVDFDRAANAEHGQLLSTATSRVGAWVLPTDEEGVIARATLAQCTRKSLATW